MQASPPAMPDAIQNHRMPEKITIARSLIHPRSCMSRCLVRAFGANPLRVPIARRNRCLGPALLSVPLALLLGPLGLFAEGLGLELVPVPFNVLQPARKMSVVNIQAKDGKNMTYSIAC